jgi:hypothetical protein
VIDLFVIIVVVAWRGASSDGEWDGHIGWNSVLLAIAVGWSPIKGVQAALATEILWSLRSRAIGCQSSVVCFCWNRLAQEVHPSRASAISVLFVEACILVIVAAGSTPVYPVHNGNIANSTAWAVAVTLVEAKVLAFHRSTAADVLKLLPVPPLGTVILEAHRRSSIARHGDILLTRTAGFARQRENCGEE